MNRLALAALVSLTAPVAGHAEEIRMGQCLIRHAGVVPNETVQRLASTHLKPDATSADCIAEAPVLQQGIRAEGAFAAQVHIQVTPDSPEVVLSVMEGRLAPDGVVLKAPSAQVKDAVIVDQLKAALQPGSPLASAKYERAILLTDDLPGIRTSSSKLVPADQVGEARFEITPVDAALIGGNVYVDNFGDAYTGRNRLGATLDINSPLRLGDKFTVGVNTTNQNTRFGYLDASVPLGSSGLRGGVTLDALSYRTEDANDLRGHSRLVELHARYPLIRSRQTNLNLAVRIGKESMQDKNDLGVVTDRVVDAGKLILDGNHTDGWLGGGASSFEVTAVVGSLNLDGYAPYQQQDEQTAKTSGHFSKLAWQLSRLQHLSGPWQTQLAVAGQVASKRLDGSQSITFGGANEFPGYHQGEILGDKGVRLHWDVRYNAAWSLIGGQQQVSWFYDIGRIKTHAKEIVGGIIVPGVQDASYTVQSTGLGFSQIWQSLRVQGAIGWRLHNKIPDELLSPGSDGGALAWVQAVYSF